MIMRNMVSLWARRERAKFAEYEIGGNLGVYCGNSREKGGGLVRERRQPEEKRKPHE